jgi:CsoR family transcriptional regulator, copper-sensing transcriptional repressor
VLAADARDAVGDLLGRHLSHTSWGYPTRGSLAFGPAVVKYGTGVCYGRRMATRQETQAPGYTPHKEQLLKRLARIEGQVRGIAKMIEDDRYCIDVLTQLGAVDTALEAVAVKVLEEHVQHCVAGALASGDPAQANEKTAELLEAVKRFAKTR